MSRLAILAGVAVVIVVSTPAFAQDVGIEPTEYDEGTFDARVHPDGSVSLRDASAVHVEGIGLSFDLTDVIMRSRGEDPYASAKLRFLDSTREDRVAMGSDYRHAQLAGAAQLMRENIAYAWATIPDAAGRKQALFDLWDECAQSGEVDLVQAGAAARAVAVEFASSLEGKDAFTQTELHRLNARRTSSIAFAPRASGVDQVATRD